MPKDADDAFPPRVELLDQEGTFLIQNKFVEFHVIQDGEVNLEFQFNIHGRPWRLNPYAALVRALEIVGGAYVPMKFVRHDAWQKHLEIMHIENPVEDYMKELLCLRKLYSRTQEDLERERHAARAGRIIDTFPCSIC